NAGRHCQQDRGLDCYETLPCATRALLHLERGRIPHRIWEPACGPGAISRVLEREGFEVFSSDIHDYGYPGAVSGLDFLTINSVSPLSAATGGIITNPPYYLAAKKAPFVAHAVKLVPYVALLLRLAFLEGLERSKLVARVARVHVSSRRIPM